MILNIKDMLPRERDYAYTQPYQLMAHTACITMMKGSFGNDGNTFYPKFEDQIKKYRTKDFEQDFDAVLEELRNVGILNSMKSLQEYCYDNPDGRFNGNFTREYGYRIDTDKYTYLLRCIPQEGDEAVYCYAYVTEHLNKHIENASKGIRFITSDYTDLFRIPDGGDIIITHVDGEKIKAYCRFFDEYHTQIGKNLYHICEFAERMEACGATYEPAPPQMPDMCYTLLPSSGEVIKIFRGEHCYRRLNMPPTDREAAQKYVDEMNGKRGVTKAQEAAMLAGSMFGWNVPAADPKSYDKNGRPIKPKSKERGEAR